MDLRRIEPVANPDVTVKIRRAFASSRRRASRETRTLIATAVLAIGVPAGAAYATAAKTGALADRLSTTAGAPVTIGGVDADLDGAVRLTDVALADLVTVDAIEASVDPASLLDGHVHADELRVIGPHVAIHVDADGDSDLARIGRRLLPRRAATVAGTAMHRTDGFRIRVTGGTLAAHVAGIGDLTADGVELFPDDTNVRIVTAGLRVRATDRVAVDLAFDRSAAEVALPQMQFTRMLAVGGTGTLAVGKDAVVLRDLAVGRRSTGGTFEIRGAVDDNGIARPIAADVTARAIAVRGDHVPLHAIAQLAPRGLDLGDARATGSVELRRDGASTQLILAGSLDHLVVDHPTVAPGPIALSGDVRANLAVTPDAITVADANLRIGKLDLAARGWVRRGAPFAGQLDVALADAPCADLLAALPDPVRGPLDGMVLAGSLSGRAHLAVDLAAPAGDGVTLTNRLAGTCRVLAEPPGADVAKLAADKSPALPRHVSGAFVAAEDGAFFDHAGFDLVQIARSLEIDLREHRIARGGSTISQQLVKNAFLTQRRSFDRKVQEAILTWRLEARLTKREILDRYLAVIELGPRVAGITAAARFWFDTTPRDLTVKQAAFLAALTSQPTAMTHRIRKAGALDADSAERVAVVLRAMHRDHVISTGAYDDAKLAPLHFAATAVDPQDR